MEWIMAFLGIGINFLSLLKNRSNTKPLSITYWLKDNWIETIQSVLFMVAVMFIITSPDIVVDGESLNEWFYSILPLPSGLLLPSKLVLPFLSGLFITKFVYWYNKRKEKWAVEKVKSLG